MTLDDLLVGVEHLHELVADGIAGRAAGADLLGAGQLGRFAEAGRHAKRIELVDQAPDRRARGQARRRVALAALGRDEEVLDRAGLALLLAGPLQKLHRLPRRRGNGIEIAVPLDRKPFDRLAGLCDPVDHTRGPLRLDADHDARRDVGI